MPLLSTSELLDRLGDPFFSLDSQGHLSYWNIQAERLLAEWFGNPAESLRESEPLSRSFPAIAGSPLAAVLRRALIEREPMIVPLAAPDGRRIEVRAWPDADGVSVLCLDVTPRGSGRQPVADVLESIGELFIAWDRQWHLTYINARAEKYLQQAGVSRAAILGQVIWKALPGLVGTPFHEAALRAVADQTEVEVEAEYPLLHRWFTVRIAPTPDGAASYSRDITARKQAEAAAHESYALLRAIVDATTDSIYVKDLQGRYVMANGAVLRGMGRSLAEIIGHTDAELFSPESARTFQLNDAKVLESGGTATFEELVQLPEGRTRVHLSTKGVYRDQAGNPVGIVGISRDISRRKAREEELRASEARFRTLMESIDDLVYELDTDQRVVSLFGRWAEREQIDPASVLGGTVEGLFGPEAREVHQEANRRALSGERVSYEWALRRPGGKRHLQLSLSPVWQEDGTVTGLVGVGREITERVLADRRQHFISEAAAVLGASLDYRTTLSTLARLVVPSLADYCLIDVLDAEGKSQRVEFAHIDGPKERALRDRVLNRAPDPRWRHSPIAQAVASGDPIFLPDVDPTTVASFGQDAEHRALLAELAPRSMMTVPLRARGRVLGALTFCYAESGRQYSAGDLTMALDLAGRAALAVDNAQLYHAAQTELAQRTRVEAELRRWADIFEHAGWGIAMVNADGRTLDALNPAFAEMHGYLPERLVGRPVTRLLVPGTTPGWFGRAGLRLLRTRQTFESVHRRRDGTTFPALVGVTPVREESGTVLYYALNVQDLTSQKRVEEQVRQAQKMEAVGRLAGGVAHDFNNMLMIIIGFSDFLAGSFEPDDSRRADADEIRKAAERASALTRQLLTFGRQRVVESAVLDPNALVLDMEGMLRPLLGERVVLEHSLAGGIGFIRGDRGQMEQVLMNLTLNARDAMPEGGVLRLETAEVTFDRGAAYRTIGIDIPAGTYVTLAVHDSGIGMDEATRSRIFEPFFTTKLAAQNSGLGLATVYGIIQQSGGYIWVDSAPGRGSTFRICLPRTEDRPPIDEAPLTTPPRGSETILVVEDEEAVRLLAARVLGDLGYTVLTARHGADALSLLARATEPIRLVITDVIMPELGGRELAEQIERLYPGMPVLYMSGYTDNDALREELDQPGTQFLQKPFSPDSLARKVREVLDRTMAA